MTDFAIPRRFRRGDTLAVTDAYSDRVENDPAPRHRYKVLYEARSKGLLVLEELNALPSSDTDETEKGDR